MPPSKGMAPAWAAARRAAAVVAVGLVLAALVTIGEDRAHIDNGFLHLVGLAIAFLIALVLVHGLRLFERWGY